MKKKEKQPKLERTDELDTQTTFADMNVDGMPWYDPKKDAAGEDSLPTLSKKEQRALIRAALLSALPTIGCAALVMLLLYGLAYVWLH